MKETIKNLKASPLFNLSLSSKELFHSNFLYWIGQNYPAEFGGLFSKYLIERPEDTSIKIYREKNNIDISLHYSNGHEILIENKVKSLPNLQQLKRYSNKSLNEQKTHILLSLSEPIFFQSKVKMEIVNVEWVYLNYSDLRVMLQSLTVKIKNDYHAQIINDYCVFIDGLIKINDHCTVQEEDLFDFHSIEKNSLYRELIDIRMHDLYLKKKYELIAYKVYEKLKSNGENLIEFGLPLSWGHKYPIIFIGSAMTRSLGLMDLKYIVNENLLLGIQIQGEHYRMVVEDNNGKAAKIVKNKLDEGLWFDFSQSFPNSEVYPKGENEFNRYGELFFYKSVKLGTEMKIKDIIDIILTDVEKIKSNHQDILKIIMNTNNV